MLMLLRKRTPLAPVWRKRQAEGKFENKRIMSRKAWMPWCLMVVHILPMPIAIFGGIWGVLRWYVELHLIFRPGASRLMGGCWESAVVGGRGGWCDWCHGREGGRFWEPEAATRPARELHHHLPVSLCPAGIVMDSARQPAPIQLGPWMEWAHGPDPRFVLSPKSIEFRLGQ